MRVLIACETSGITRRAFASRGHEVLSVDVLPAQDGCGEAFQDFGSGFMRHVIADARAALAEPFDLVIAHPPCTYLANSGVRWLYQRGTRERIPERWAALAEGAALFKACLDANAPRVAVENPIQHGHARALIGRVPSQVIQPWQFGHGETKATCLWLRGLPPLQATNVVQGREGRIWKLPPSPTRWQERSKTFQGIAEAMADQWGDL